MEKNIVLKKTTNLVAAAPEPQESDGCGMDIENYQFWFDALRNKDTDVVLSTLNQADGQELNRLLNGWFEYDNEENNRLHDIFRDTKKDEMKATRPFILAGLYGSHDVMLSLLQHGADPYCIEEGDQNLIHTMVLISHFFPQFEDDQSVSYRQCSVVLGKDRMSVLLRLENTDGLRPLELAAKLGCCKMVKAILETPGVYLTKEKTRGMVHYQWIDVTEYETADPELDRRGKSPLGYFALMDEQTLVQPGTMELFTWPPFQMWINAKLYSSAPFVVIWFLIRMVMITVYFILLVDKSLLQEFGGIPKGDSWDSNNTLNYTFVFCPSYAPYSLSPTVRTSLFVYMTAHAYYSSIFNVAECILIRVRQTPRYLCCGVKTGNPVVVTRGLYFLNQLSLTFLLAITGTLQLGNVNNPGYEYLIPSFNLIFMINITFSVMFFFQLLPIVGIYVITARRMLRDLLNFSFLYMLWLVPFSLYLLVFFNTNSKHECVREFSNMAESLYSTFRLMLNMLDLTGYDMHTPQVLHLVHVIYVFMVAILLINFLIAVMATSAARIASLDKVIFNIERLYVALIVESRIGWFCEILLRRFKANSMLICNMKYYLLNIEYK